MYMPKLMMYEEAKFILKNTFIGSDYKYMYVTTLENLSVAIITFT